MISNIFNEVGFGIPNVKYNSSKIKTLERLLFLNIKSGIYKYKCSKNGLSGFFIKYLFIKPFRGILHIKYFIYRYILLGMLRTIYFLKLHDLVTEDYYIHKINKFVLNSTKNNKWFLGNIYGFSLFGIVEIFGIILVTFIDTMLVFFADGLDFRGLYKIKYLLEDNLTIDLYVLEKHSNLFNGCSFFKSDDQFFNIITSTTFLKKEHISGLSKCNISGRLRYHSNNKHDSKSKVMLANYYLNGLTFELGEKIIRIIKVNTHYKLALIFESNAIPNQNDYAAKNLLLLENCSNFSNKIITEFDGLHFKN